LGEGFEGDDSSGVARAAEVLGVEADVGADVEEDVDACGGEDLDSAGPERDGLAVAQEAGARAVADDLDA
jgi:hypothetical protein